MSECGGKNYDWRLCDVCQGRVFYDADLAYDEPDAELGELPVRGRGYTLNDLGDWQVICQECAKTHEVRVVRREASEKEEKQA